MLVGLRESGLRSLKSDMVTATRARKADVKSDIWESCGRSLNMFCPLVWNNEGTGVIGQK